MTSLKEIQEQERRRSSGVSAPPPPALASGPPSWGGAPPRATSRMHDSLAGGTATARAVAMRPVQPKPTPSAPAVQAKHLQPVSQERCRKQRAWWRPSNDESLRRRRRMICSGIMGRMPLARLRQRAPRLAQSVRSMGWAPATVAALLQLRPPHLLPLPHQRYPHTERFTATRERSNDREAASPSQSQRSSASTDQLC